jgi:hypothetical protein
VFCRTRTPFEPDNRVDDWESLLGHWLRGTALGACTDNEGVSFVQDNIVYRLVWAVEAARLHLQHIEGEDEDPPGGTLALCLTYGVPNPTCALFMQAGLRSRTLATAVAKEVDPPLADIKELRVWIRMLRKGAIDPIEWKTNAERAEWKRFLGRFDHQEIAEWRDIEAILPVRWHRSNASAAKTRVRVTRLDGGQKGVVSSVSSVSLGETTIPADIRCDYFTGLACDNQSSIAVSFFGY